MDANKRARDSLIVREICATAVPTFQFECLFFRRNSATLQLFYITVLFFGGKEVPARTDRVCSLLITFETLAIRRVNAIGFMHHCRRRHCVCVTTKNVRVLRGKVCLKRNLLCVQNHRQCHIHIVTVARVVSWASCLHNKRISLMHCSLNPIYLMGLLCAAQQLCTCKCPFSGNANPGATFMELIGLRLHLCWCGLRKWLRV